MLGKLIKYDFKAMSHAMFPIYLATIVLTALFSLMIKFDIEEGFIFSVFTFLFNRLVRFDVCDGLLYRQPFHQRLA